MERREFGKKSRPPKTWWQKILLFFKFYASNQTGWGHHDRMQERKRKSKFDRW